MKYDVIIIGAGPAGLSAALYAARATLSVLIIEKSIVGGLITTTTEIENYPGSEEGSTGTSITTRMHEQAVDAGAVLEYDEIEDFAQEDNIFTLKGMTGTTYQSSSVIIASGTYPRLLGVKGEEEFRGRGVSYCATCDAGFFKEKHVAVVGGGDSALKEAEYLTKFASKVTLIHRRDAFRAGQLLVDRITANKKIQIFYDSVVEEIKGEMKVNSIAIKNVKSEQVQDYLLDGIFIFAGYKPNTEIFSDIVQINDSGYIITNEKMETSIPGLYAAGDIREKTLRQVITAASDGAIAGVQVEKYLSEQ